MLGGLSMNDIESWGRFPCGRWEPISASKIRQPAGQVSSLVLRSCVLSATAIVVKQPFNALTSFASVSMWSAKACRFLSSAHPLGVIRKEKDRPVHYRMSAYLHRRSPYSAVPLVSSGAGRLLS